MSIPVFNKKVANKVRSLISEMPKNPNFVGAMYNGKELGLPEKFMLLVYKDGQIDITNMDEDGRILEMFLVGDSIVLPALNLEEETSLHVKQ